MTVALLDVDGTLVDSNYQHTLAWYRALRENGIVLPIWRIHRHTGMGGDQLLGALLDDDTERQLGESIRSAERRCYMEMVDEIEVTAGAVELLDDLRDRGHTAILASSARGEELERYLDMLDARGRVDGWTSADDVNATKPAPDLVLAGLERAGAGPGAEAVMIGDSPWDVRAASKAGVPTVAVLTGGFSRDELAEAGARAVFESVAELRGALDSVFPDGPSRPPATALSR